MNSPKMVIRNFMDRFSPEKKNIVFRRVFFVIFILIIALIQNTPHFSVTVWGIEVFLLIPLVVCVSMFEKIIPAAIFGLLAGSLWDINVSIGDGFYALFLSFVAASCSMMINYYMRNNLSTAALLCGIALLLYILIHWLCFVVFRGIEGGVFTIISFYLPSAFVSLIFLVPLYAIVRGFIKRLKNKYPVKINVTRE